MKIIIDIPEKTNAHIRSDYGHGVKGLRDEDREIVCDAIYNGRPIKDITDEQISDAFQIAIANYFESKSKYLTPPPSPSSPPSSCCASKNKMEHGEWVNKDYGIGECFAECSECGEETNGTAEDTGFGYDYSFPNFCPNCGADMREGEAE